MSLRTGKEVLCKHSGHLCHVGTASSICVCVRMYVCVCVCVCGLCRDNYSPFCHTQPRPAITVDGFYCESETLWLPTAIKWYNWFVPIESIKSRDNSRLWCHLAGSTWKCLPEWKEQIRGYRSLKYLVCYHMAHDVDELFAAGLAVGLHWKLLICITIVMLGSVLNKCHIFQDQTAHLRVAFCYDHVESHCCN